MKKNIYMKKKINSAIHMWMCAYKKRYVYAGKRKSYPQVRINAFAIVLSKSMYIYMYFAEQP